jgi:hypothetical protein
MEKRMREKNLMIAIVCAGVSFALLSSLTQLRAAQKWSDSRDGKEYPAESLKHERPFACDRLALSPEARKRHFDELGPALRLMRNAVRELPDGYEIQFPSDPKTILMVAEWAAGERLCCPFFDIQLRMEPEGGPFWLRLGGRKGTKDFIKADGASWIKAVD